MPDWFEQLPLWWIAGLSSVTFLGSLVIVPFVAVRMPEDYFLTEKRRPDAWGQRHRVARLVLSTIKNILGLMLLATGVVMLVLPGQGVLTIFLGLVIMNFPGKYRLERLLIARGPVLRGVNWIRGRAGAPPLRVPD